MIESWVRDCRGSQTGLGAMGLAKATPGRTSLVNTQPTTVRSSPCRGHPFRLALARELRHCFWPSPVFGIPCSNLVACTLFKRTLLKTFDKFGCRVDRIPDLDVRRSRTELRDHAWLGAGGRQRYARHHGQSYSVGLDDEDMGEMSLKDAS